MKKNSKLVEEQNYPPILYIVSFNVKSNKVNFMPVKA